MNREEWNKIIASFPQANFLQTWEWGEIKTRYGWNANHRTWVDSEGKIQAAALILQREQIIPILGAKIRILYIPKGPLLNWNSISQERVFNDLSEYAKREAAIYLKIDPDLIIAEGLEGHKDYVPIQQFSSTIQHLLAEGWLLSKQQIQFKNTFMLDLNDDETVLLDRMKQKTRYNIRLAKKRGVTVRTARIDELDVFYRMYAETASRDNFIIRPKEYYLDVWRTFISAGMANPLLAEVDHEPVAGLVLFHFNKKAWYFYGMSTMLHREKMPNYLLQWEAIRLCKSLGCSHYDLWGAPDVFKETDRLWGVYRFKEGLGARIIQTIGALDYPVKKIEYKIMQDLMPRFLIITRKIRARQIQDEILG